MSRDPYVSGSPPSSVLQAYFPVEPVEQLESLGNAGGFSGTQFWRFVAADSQWCLRRWPQQHPTPDKLAWIHRVLLHASEHGAGFLAVPKKLNDGRTFCSEAGHLWEVSEWMPGQANYWSEPANEKLVAVLSGLARFHVAAQDLANEQSGPAPGVVDRQKQLVLWCQQEPTVRLQTQADPELAELALQAIHLMPALYPTCAAGLAQGVRVRLDLQPCIRDIWHDHVLFDGSTKPVSWTSAR